MLFLLFTIVLYDLYYYLVVLWYIHINKFIGIFLGSFDPEGKWLDGIFTRKLRVLCAPSKDANIAGKNSLKILTLVGPLGSPIEDLFSANLYAMYSSLTSMNALSGNRLVTLPSTGITFDFIYIYIYIYMALIHILFFVLIEF